MVCFTCGLPIAHLWDKYLDLITKSNGDKFEALAELKIFRHCCRKMFISQYDMYDKIS